MGMVKMENNDFRCLVLEERQNLKNDTFILENEDGLGANFFVKCNSNADEVMELARKTLLSVNYQYDSWNGIEDWMNKKWEEIIPKNFINRCLPEKTSNNSFFGKLLNVFSKKNDDRWSLNAWLYILEPRDRMWFWYGSTLLIPQENNYFLVSVKVIDDPFSSETLRWLLLGSGAEEVFDEYEWDKLWS